MNHLAATSDRDSYNDGSRDPGTVGVFLASWFFPVYKKGFWVSGLTAILFGGEPIT